MAHDNDVTVPLAPQQAPDSPKVSAQQPAQPQVHPAEDATQVDTPGTKPEEAKRPTVIGLDENGQQPTDANADVQATQPIGGQSSSDPESTQPLPNGENAAQNPWADGAACPEVNEKVAAQMEYLHAKEQFKAASKKAGKRTPQIAASIAIAAVLLFGGGAAGWAIGSAGAHADAGRTPHAIENSQDGAGGPRGYLNAPDGTNGGDNQGYGRGYGYGYGSRPDADNGQQAPDSGSNQQAPRGGFDQQGAPGTPETPGAPGSQNGNGSDSDTGKQAPPSSGNSGNSGSGNSGNSDGSGTNDSGGTGSNSDGQKGKNGSGNAGKPNNNGSDTGSFWNGNSGK